MRTSLTETERLENWLLKKGDMGERLLTDAQIQLDPSLKENAKWQRFTYKLVQEYGRQELIEEIKSVEQKLFSNRKHKNFRERIRAIFRK